MQRRLAEIPAAIIDLRQARRVPSPAASSRGLRDNSLNRRIRRAACAGAARRDASVGNGFRRPCRFFHAAEFL
jgi:hypothetical protein